jgi:hypothetical protein
MAKEVKGKMTAEEVLQVIWGRLTNDLFTGKVIDFPADNFYVVLEKFNSFMADNNSELAKLEHRYREESGRRSALTMTIRRVMTTLGKTLEENEPVRVELSLANSVPVDMVKVKEALKPFPLAPVGNIVPAVKIKIDGETVNVHKGGEAPPTDSDEI